RVDRGKDTLHRASGHLRPNTERGKRSRQTHNLVSRESGHVRCGGDGLSDRQNLRLGSHGGRTEFRHRRTQLAVVVLRQVHHVGKTTERHSRLVSRHVCSSRELTHRVSESLKVTRGNTHLGTKSTDL